MLNTTAFRSVYNKKPVWRIPTAIRLVLIAISLLYLHERNSIFTLLSSSSQNTSSASQWLTIFFILVLVFFDYVPSIISVIRHSLQRVQSRQAVSKTIAKCLGILCIVTCLIFMLFLLQTTVSQSSSREFIPLGFPHSVHDNFLTEHEAKQQQAPHHRPAPHGEHLDGGHEWHQDMETDDTISNEITVVNICEQIQKDFRIDGDYLSNKQHALWLSRAVYCDPYKLDKYMVKLIDRKLFIAFTGTQVDDISDIFIDIKFFKTRKFGDYIHSGFYDRSLQYFLPADNFTYWFEHHVMNITDFGNLDEIIWSGHSLGGAVAQIMGSFFYEYCAFNKECKHNIQSSEIVTFGSPLVFNQLNRVHPNMTHVINANDLVPRILRQWEIIYSGGFFLHLCWKYMMEILGIWMFIHFGILYIDKKLNTKQIAVTYLVWFILAYFVGQLLWFHIVLMLLLCMIKYCYLRCNDNPQNSNCSLTNLSSKYFDYTQHAHNLVIVKVLLLILIILFLYSVLIDVIHPEYYAHGNVIHIGFDFCRTMKATQWYKRMRYGFDEEDVGDHFMNNYIRDWKQSVSDANCHEDAEWDESSIHTLSMRAVWPFVAMFFIFFTFCYVSKNGG